DFHVTGVQTCALPISADDSINYVQFRSMKKLLKKPFVIYADFESILTKYEDNGTCETKKYQKHIPCGYAYKRVSTVEKYDKDIVLFRSETGEGVAERFIKDLLNEAKEIRKIMKNIVPINLTKDQEQEF